MRFDPQKLIINLLCFTSCENLLLFLYWAEAAETSPHLKKYSASFMHVLL